MTGVQTCALPILDILGSAPGFQFEEVYQSLSGLLENMKRRAEFGELALGVVAFFDAGRMEPIRVAGRRTFVKSRFESVWIQPRASGFTEQGERVGHGMRGRWGAYALKLSPQEQLVAALGFFTLNPPSVSTSR